MVKINIPSSEMALLNAIQLESFHCFNTMIEINNAYREISLEVIAKCQSSCPNIMGYWQDFIIANIKAMARNMVNDKLDSVAFNMSFTQAGVQYTIRSKISKIAPKEIELVQVEDIIDNNAEKNDALINNNKGASNAKRRRS